MSLALYDIAQELVALRQLRDDAESEGNAEAVSVIDGQIQEWVKGCLATKADGIRGYIKHAEAQTEAWAAEAARYGILARKGNASIDRLKQYVLDAMRLLDSKKIEGAKGDVVLRRRGNSGLWPLVIAQPKLVPDDMLFLNVKMSLSSWNEIKGVLLSRNVVCEAGKCEPNNSAIRAALDRGEGVPGCRLDDRGEHLVVE